MMGTFFLYVTSYISLSNAAAIATIVAAVSTAAYNIYRIYKERENGRNKNRNGSV